MISSSPTQMCGSHTSFEEEQSLYMKSLRKTFRTSWYNQLLIAKFRIKCNLPDFIELHMIHSSIQTFIEQLEQWIFSEEQDVVSDL